MIFVQPSELVTITYKSHNQDTSLLPTINVYDEFGNTLYTGTMTHKGAGLYTFKVEAIPDPGFMISVVNSKAGVIVVGTPAITKIFYYDENLVNNVYAIKNEHSLNDIETGTMVDIGHNLYVFSTKLIGTFVIIAGDSEGGVIQLPLREDSELRIIGEYNVLDKDRDAYPYQNSKLGGTTDFSEFNVIKWDK